MTGTLQGCRRSRGLQGQPDVRLSPVARRRVASDGSTRALPKALGVAHHAPSREEHSESERPKNADDRRGENCKTG